MKSVWSLFAAITLSLGCVGLAQAAEPAPAADPAALEAALFALPGDPAPASMSSQPLVIPAATVYCQQPLTYVRHCREIWGRYAPGPCGANTWHWTGCTQYKDPSGLWFYANCGLEQTTCSEPTGAECITSCPS